MLFPLRGDGTPSSLSQKLILRFLKFENEISEIFSAEEIIPSAGQGVIALQCRENDDETISILNKINCKNTLSICNQERNLLKK